MKQQGGCDKKIQKKQSNVKSKQKLQKTLTSILSQSIQDVEQYKRMRSFYFPPQCLPEQEQSNNSDTEKTICVKGQTQKDLVYQMFEVIKYLKFSFRVQQLQCAHKVNKITMMQQIRQDILQRIKQ